MLEIALEAIELAAIGLLTWRLRVGARARSAAVVESRRGIDRLQRWHKRLSRRLDEHISSNLHRR